MKKFLAIGLLSCAFALTGVLATACSDEDEPDSSSSSSSSSVAAQMLGVTFENGEGYEFLSNASEDGVPMGSTLAFEIDIGAFYAGNPEVYVNGVLLSPDADGVYSVPNVSEALTIRAEGIRKDVSVMEGSGSFDDAFVVTRPIDLLKIAQEVNRGNTNYSNACYVLANDIDCKGEELEIIGDNNTSDAIFSGSFVGVSNPDTGEVERHVISNFTINSEDSNYVGLFGAVFANMSLESTATFYGVSLDNFTVNAGVSSIKGDNKTICAGGLIGYSVGANIMLCDVTNGEIFLYADSNYFSYVGGLIGYQMGFYDSSYGTEYPSEVSYAVCTTDVYVTGGVALYAGGVVGYTATNAAYNATTLVRNSYFQGSISNGLRSGGVVGGLGQYTSVSNCYAVGTISSQSVQSENNPLIMTTDYCHAYAGGIVGYAENDSIVNDSFFNGEVVVSTASNEQVYAHKDFLVGGGDPAGSTSVGSQRYVALDCLSNIDLADDGYLTETLGWGDYDWIFLPNKLPTINYVAPEERIKLTLTFHYVAPLLTGEDKSVLVGGDSSLEYTYFDTSIQSLASYTPLGSFVSGDSGNALLDSDYVSDLTNGVYYLSYGFFFDKECTKPVPSGYTPEKNVTLYVGFADPTKLIGSEATERTYSIYAEGLTAPLTMTFGKYGTVTYSDGSTTLTSRYAFDGTTVLVKDARLARYFQGKLTSDDATEDADPYAPYASVYAFYDFKGVFSGEDLLLFDGAYFTESAPLLCVNANKGYRGEYYDANAQYAFYGNTAVVLKNDESKTYSLTSDGTTLTLTNGDETLSVAIADLNEYDAFKGSWTLSANTDKVYTFDGKGGWSYSYKTYLFNGVTTSYTVETESGSYTSADGRTLSLDNGASVTFNSDGFLTVTQNGYEQLYYGAQSYVGTWLGDGYELTLSGIRYDGYGNATLVEDGGYITELLYEVSERGYINFYYVASATEKSSLCGFGEYDGKNCQLIFRLPDATSGEFVEQVLRLYDEYNGDWISDSSAFANALLSFNGLGLYEGYGLLTITTADATVQTAYSITGGQNGSTATFVYQSVAYELTFDEREGNLQIAAQASSLERKDELADKAFIDLDGVRYSFDGRSSLQNGAAEGILTVRGATEVAYTYAKSALGYTVYQNGNPVGELTEQATCYALSLNGDDKTLYLENEFMGDWALGMQYDLFKIGPTDLNGDIQAYYKGIPVTLTFLNPDVLTFSVVDNKMPYTYYVFVVADTAMQSKVLAMSEYPYLIAGGYTLCTKANALYGTWTYIDGDGFTTSLKFDGISTSYQNGYAELSLSLKHNTIITEYYYSMRARGIVLWSQETMNNRTWYYRLDLVEYSAALEGKEYFTNPNSSLVLVRTEVDGLYLAEAVDADDQTKTYFFDGLGGLYVGNETTPSYTYVIKAYNDDLTATLELTKDGKTYAATLNYANSSKVILDIGEEIAK